MTHANCLMGARSAQMEEYARKIVHVLCGGPISAFMEYIVLEETDATFDTTVL